MMSQTQRRGGGGGYEDNKGKMGISSEKTSPYNGRSMVVDKPIQRQKTDSELLAKHNKFMITSPEMPPRRPAKLLLNVTLERSLGAVQLVMSPESKVGDLVAAAIRQYVKEGRRPYLQTTDSSAFNLHYSQFTFECLDREEKLLTLGSRNFFMCHNKEVTDAGAAATANKTSSSLTLCSNQVGKASKIAIPWLRFMDFLM